MDASTKKEESQPVELIKCGKGVDRLCSTGEPSAYISEYGVASYRDMVYETHTHGSAKTDFNSWNDPKLENEDSTDSEDTIYSPEKCGTVDSCSNESSNFADSKESGYKSASYKNPYVDFIKEQTKGHRIPPLIPRGNKKPAFSYVALIATVLEESKEKKLTLRDIYTAIMNKWTYFKRTKANWQNSIRHNLSLNDCFIKVPKQGATDKKGNYWTLSPRYKFSEMFEDGKFERRKRRRSSTRAYGHFPQYTLRYTNGRHTGFPPPLYNSSSYPYTSTSSLAPTQPMDLSNTVYSHNAPAYPLTTDDYCGNSLITATAASAATVAAFTSSFTPYQPPSNLFTAHLPDYSSTLQYYTPTATTDFQQQTLPSLDYKSPSLIESEQALHLHSTLYQTPFGYRDYQNDWIGTADESVSIVDTIGQNAMTAAADLITMTANKERYDLQEVGDSYQMWERSADEQKPYLDYSWH